MVDETEFLRNIIVSAVDEALTAFRARERQRNGIEPQFLTAERIADEILLKLRQSRVLVLRDAPPMCD